MSIVISPPFKIGQVFRALMSHDPNLSLGNFDITARTCRDGLPANLPIDDLLQPGPVNLNGIEWDFELNNGIRSLVRRGFYEILDQPVDKKINNFPTWNANVLYYPSIGYPKLFKFAANIGPLVNRNAIGFDFSRPGTNIISAINPTEKCAYLNSMRNKVFYVSQERYITNENQAGPEKQTVWFKFRD